MDVSMFSHVFYATSEHHEISEKLFYVLVRYFSIKSQNQFAEDR